MKVLLYFSGLVFLLSMVACTGGKRSTEKTFVYCSEGSPSAFNPQVATDGTTFTASSKTVYNRLVEFEYGTTNLIPALAESWEISEDTKEFTFKLRKGVKFHTTSYFTPTREFNADDVIFTFHRMMKDDHPYNKVGGGNYEYFTSMEMNDIIKEIKKVDDYTVKFILNRKEAPFLANLAMDFASILSKEYGETLLERDEPEKIDYQPVGTGPFVYQSYQKDTLIRFTGFKDYFRGAPKLDNLVFSITPDASVRYQKLKKGECHLIIEPAPADIASMKKEEGIVLDSMPGLNVGYLAFNTEKKPFDNRLVRQAMNHALNKKAYIEAIYLGNAMVAKNPIPPAMWSYNDDIEDYDYNVEKAKELLKKAGYEDGFSAELWTLPVTRPYNPNGKKMGEMMQEDLSKIGVEVTLVSYDWPTYLNKSQTGEHDMLQLGWTGDNGDPDNFLNVLLSCAGVKGGANRARWCNKDFDKLIQKGKATSEQEKRSEYYRKAQEIFKKEAPWATLAHARVFRAMSERVKGYKIEPLGSDVFYHVDIE